MMIRLLILLVLLWPGASWAAIAFGTGNHIEEDTADNSVTTPAITVNAGDGIFCVGKWETTGDISGISDGTNSLTLSNLITYGGGSFFLRGGYKANASGGGSGQFAITFSSGSTEYKRFYCGTMTGQDTGTVLDQQNSGTAVNGVAATANVTTTVNTLCVGFGGATSGGTWNTQTINGVAATVRESNSDFNAYTRVVTGTFTGAASSTHSLAGNVGAGVLCFKEAGGGGGGGSPATLMLMGVGK